METVVPAHSQDGPSGAPPRTREPANWDDDDAPVRALKPAEAARFRDQRLSPAPWRVVRVQAEAGLVFALVAWLVGGPAAAGSALWGAATVALPGALMARAVARMADSRSVAATALGLLGWESAKLICTALMLVVGAHVLKPVVWLALLGSLAGCLAVYWVALAWRPPTRK